MSGRHSLPGRKGRRANVRPAPFGITPSIVRGVLELAGRTPPAVVHVPILPIRLVDRPKGGMAPPANANEISSRPPHSPCPMATEGGEGQGQRLGWLEGEGRGDGATAADSLPQPVEQQLRLPVHPIPHLAGQPERPFEAGEPARKSDALHRQAKDQDARELEKPTDAFMRDRRELIRATAQRLTARPEPAAQVRPSFGARVEKRPAALAPSDFELRRQLLERAIAHLKTRCILVSPNDREARIRTYRVSGKRDSKLAEEVIQIAVEHGFEVARG